MTTADIHVLKTRTCASLSGKSTLTYSIGSDANEKGQGDIYFRIDENTGRGLFCREWIALSAVKQLFGKGREKSTITSTSLGKIFAGKSINTAGFLLAALKAENLVAPTIANLRCYEPSGSAEFADEIKALIAAKGTSAPTTDASASTERKEKSHKVAKHTNS